MSNRTILSLAFLSVLLFVSLTESSNAQDQATEEYQAAKKAESAEAAKQKDADAAAKSAAAEAALYRTWSTPDGKFSVLAKYILQANEHVTLQKKDGSKVEVPLERLCEKDVDFIKTFQLERRLERAHKKQKEATYAGITVSQWAEALKDKDEFTRRVAARALAKSVLRPKTPCLP